MHACRAVQCQQFEMALLLLEAGADPLHTCTTADGCQSLPPLTAVMYAIPAGDPAHVTTFASTCSYCNHGHERLWLHGGKVNGSS